MNRLIQRAHIAEAHTFCLTFNRRADPGCGFAFPCDAQGTIIKKEMGEIAWHSLGGCIENVGNEFLPPEIVQYTNRYWEPAIVQCDCGEKVHIHISPGAYNYESCDACGRTYNPSGQQLTNPSTWMPDDAYGDPERPDCD